jgi:hypothetical protein
MGCKVIYRPDEDYVHAMMKGEVDLAMVHRYTGEIIEQLNAHHCRRLLNDLRKASPKLSTLDIYELPAWIEEEAERAGIDRYCKRALLVSRDFEDYRFFETVSRNHGHLVEVFADSNITGIFRAIAAAREWLGLTPAQPASGRKPPAPAPAQPENVEGKAQDGPTTGN